MKLLALALFAATLSAAPIVVTTTTDLGGGVWNYSYEFDADPGELTNLVAIILPWVGTPDYLPLNIVLPGPPDWQMTRNTCGYAPTVPAGTGCWAASGPYRQTGTVSFDTGYAPVSGHVVVNTTTPGGFAIVADVPDYDNTVVENPAASFPGTAVPEPASFAPVALGLGLLLYRRSTRHRSAA